MQVLTISLPSALARRRLIQAQVDTPGMPPHRFLDAVDGRTLSRNELAALYDDIEARRYYGHSMTAPEIGCAASHRAAYRLSQTIACAVPCRCSCWVPVRRPSSC